MGPPLCLAPFWGRVGDSTRCLPRGCRTREWWVGSKQTLLDCRQQLYYWLWAREVCVRLVGLALLWKSVGPPHFKLWNGVAKSPSLEGYVLVLLGDRSLNIVLHMHPRPWYCWYSVSWQTSGTSERENRMPRETVALHKSELKMEWGRVITGKLYQGSRAISFTGTQVFSMQKAILCTKKDGLGAVSRKRSPIQQIESILDTMWEPNDLDVPDIKSHPNISPVYQIPCPNLSLIIKFWAIGPTQTQYITQLSLLLCNNFFSCKYYWIMVNTYEKLSCE